MQAETLAAACVGKLPTHGDFVSHRAGTPAMRAFDEWVQKGLYRARQRDGSWEDRFHEAPPMDFVFTPRKTSNLLLGVLQPSRDRSGRAYPFTVACEIPKASVDTRCLPYLPLHAESFLSEAARVVHDAVNEDISYREVADHVDQIDSSLRPRSSPPQTYAHRLKHRTMGEFVESLYGAFDDPRKYRVWKNLLDVVRSLKRQSSPPRLNYGVQYPLGADEESFTSHACFWLDTTLRLADHPNVESTFFWPSRRVGSIAPFFLLFIGAPQARVVPYLFGSSGAARHVYSLAETASTSDSDPARALPETYRSLLDDEDLRLWDFLERL